ncbi:hypothetical protein KDK95_15015 [Actinospica sp. MGRD01-02]|uniref:Uncharacterized protein n=1 Tax=Actinospica acidithermotolerans TaxID=2828514 RepID=A0A941EAI1_9ACTN|nr:hypothetical protein [Actinospica acidithermotolerans]MBR7827627.1 hypothetical protein [Actinospica acidithermotolerans]
MPPSAAQTKPASTQPHPLHWLGYAALCGWLAGPLLAAGYWMASGDADEGQVHFSPGSAYAPCAGLLLVWGAFVWMTHSTLNTGWRVAAKRAALVLGFGSAGWLLVQFLDLPAGSSINQLALEWAALTLPYPAAAAIVQRRALRPVVDAVAAVGAMATVSAKTAREAAEAAVPAPTIAPRWILRYRTHAIGAACLAVLAGGLAMESVGNGQATAADMPVRSATAEPEAPAAMLLLVKPPSRYRASSYGYVDGVATISYSGHDTPTPAADDLEVIVAPGTGSPCSVDWSSADYSVAEGDRFSCSQTSAGRWVADDGSGDRLYIGGHGCYLVALAVDAASDDPIDPASLPKLFGTLHEAGYSQRALLNAEEDAQF